MSVVRETRNGREVIECSVCRDGTELTGPAEQRAAEAGAFRARHPETTHQPPSLERAARRRSP